MAIFSSLGSIFIFFINGSLVSLCWKQLTLLLIFFPFFIEHYACFVTSFSLSCIFIYFYFMLFLLSFFLFCEIYYSYKRTEENWNRNNIYEHTMSCIMNIHFYVSFFYLFCTQFKRNVEYFKKINTKRQIHLNSAQC